MMTQNCITSSQKCIFYNNNNRNICIWLFLHFFTAPTRYKYQSSLVVVLFVFQLTFPIGSATFLRHNLFINNLATKCNLNCMYFFHIIFGKIVCDFFFWQMTAHLSYGCFGLFSKKKKCIYFVIDYIIHNERELYEINWRQMHQNNKEKKNENKQINWFPSKVLSWFNDIKCNFFSSLFQ